MKSRFIVLFLVLLVVLGVGIFFMFQQRKTAPGYSDRLVPPTQPSVIIATTTPGGEKVTVKGKMMCLPKKNTSGPQTMECAIGLKAIDGKYYAVRDSDPTYTHISKLPMNENVVIHGTFEAKTDAKYPTVGILVIDSVEN